MLLLISLILSEVIRTKDLRSGSGNVGISSKKMAHRPFCMGYAISQVQAVWRARWKSGTLPTPRRISSSNRRMGPITSAQ